MKKLLVLSVVALALSASAADNPSKKGQFSITNINRLVERFDSMEAVHTEYQKRFNQAPDFGIGRRIYLPKEVQLALPEVAFVVPTPQLIGLENEPVGYGAVPNKAFFTNSQFKVLARHRPLTAGKQILSPCCGLAVTLRSSQTA
ncbi:MAG: hypothetical protein HZA89_08895 [Verrucomicrobia bacterium]|nr:hypothetical protein [Verrucomicrobiota bacterium]